MPRLESVEAIIAPGNAANVHISIKAYGDPAPSIELTDLSDISVQISDAPADKSLLVNNMITRLSSRGGRFLLVLRALTEAVNYTLCFKANGDPCESDNTTTASDITAMPTAISTLADNSETAATSTANDNITFFNDPTTREYTDVFKENSTVADSSEITDIRFSETTPIDIETTPLATFTTPITTVVELNQNSTTAAIAIPVKDREYDIIVIVACVVAGAALLTGILVACVVYRRGHCCRSSGKAEKCKTISGAHENRAFQPPTDMELALGMGAADTGVMRNASESSNTEMMIGTEFLDDFNISPRFVDYKIINNVLF